MLVTSETGRLYGTGVAVAVEAPAHAERRHLGDRFHLVDAAVAGDAADACRHVRAVGEIGVVGKLVDANPAHRPAARRRCPESVRAARCPSSRADGSSCRSGWAERSRRQRSRPRRDSSGNRDRARRRGACGCTGRAGRDGSRRPCTTGKRSTRRPRCEHDRGCPRWRPRSGACSTRGGRSGPRELTPGGSVLHTQRARDRGPIQSFEHAASRLNEPGVRAAARVYARSFGGSRPGCAPIIRR